VIDQGKVAYATRLLLDAVAPGWIGDPGLSGTPERVARMWAEFIDYDPGTLDTTFESVKTDQMVVVSQMTVWSLCSHHLLPFSAKMAVGYIARDRIIGLSKLARLAHLHAHRPQTQEELCEDIANHLAEILDHPDVAVMADGFHLCMAMRGIKTPATMTTAIMRGAFLDQPDTRAEFHAYANR
jgi:GTP cyclohydrolase I